MQTEACRIPITGDHHDLETYQGNKEDEVSLGCLSIYNARKNGTKTLSRLTSSLYFLDISLSEKVYLLVESANQTLCHIPVEFGAISVSTTQFGREKRQCLVLAARPTSVTTLTEGLKMASTCDSYFSATSSKNSANN
ncbi:hypothetical protein EGR_03853 [Echinococcus granulosus]|uniref:Uncharacterized protein n=1 Tax=Echinococcus granulosus TaxID=6210 RepID=W6USM1_ECHGR|nr:hypothetical protein EGR_03853 [Echinococcus granulosus]EUB61367.1 hypothetical protein EGR_03853 [Echinococcus granulosus]